MLRRIALALAAFAAFAGGAVHAQALDGRLKQIVENQEHRHRLPHRCDAVLVHRRQEPDHRLLDRPVQAGRRLDRAPVQHPGPEDQVGAGHRADPVRCRGQGPGRHGMRLEHGHPVAPEAGRFLQLHLRRDHRAARQGSLRPAQARRPGGQEDRRDRGHHQRARDQRPAQAPPDQRQRGRVQVARRGACRAGRRQGRRVRVRQAAAGGRGGDPAEGREPAPAARRGSLVRALRHRAAARRLRRSGSRSIPGSRRSTRAATSPTSSASGSPRWARPRRCSRRSTSSARFPNSRERTATWPPGGGL